MKYFRKIPYPECQRVLARLRPEIAANDHLWLADDTRQKRIHVQRNTQSIPLRAVLKNGDTVRKAEDIQESYLTPYSACFPQAMSFLNGAADYLHGSLERALYARLLPNSVVYPHVDSGQYYLVRDRYHFVVDSPSGSVLKAGGEQVTMMPGELWWFENKALHESENLSETWRTHLIFDVF